MRLLTRYAVSLLFNWYIQIRPQQKHCHTTHVIYIPSIILHTIFYFTRKNLYTAPTVTTEHFHEFTYTCMYKNIITFNLQLYAPTEMHEKNSSLPWGLTLSLLVVTFMAENPKVRLCSYKTFHAKLN